jgi:SPOC domain
MPNVVFIQTPKSWSGSLMMKKSLFSLQLHLVSGSGLLISAIDDGSETPLVEIKQRLKMKKVSLFSTFYLFQEAGIL